MIEVEFSFVLFSDSIFEEGIGCIRLEKRLSRGDFSHHHSKLKYARRGPVLDIAREKGLILLSYLYPIVCYSLSERHARTA